MGRLEVNYKASLQEKQAKLETLDKKISP